MCGVATSSYCTRWCKVTLLQGAFKVKKHSNIWPPISSGSLRGPVWIWWSTFKDLGFGAKGVSNSIIYLQPNTILPWCSHAQMVYTASWKQSSCRGFWVRNICPTIPLTPLPTVSHLPCHPTWVKGQWWSFILQEKAPAFPPWFCTLLDWIVLLL